TGEIVGEQQAARRIQVVQRRRTAARLLVGVNVAVFLTMVLRGVSFFEPSVAALVHWGALDPQLFLAGQRWRLLSSAFVHIGVLHLALNMWCLWALAEWSESLFGAGTTIALYLLTALTGGVLSMEWMLLRGAGHVSAGASGAIFGLAGAVVTSLRVGRHRIPLEVRRRISNSALQFAVINLVFGLLPNIDNAAHLGGMVGGLALGACFGGTQSMLTQDDKPLARAIACLVFLLLLALLMRSLFPSQSGRWL
ncbi:MAG: rhomboid family intramembrane serine protease, partial [Acidobacteriales bacterium]|nr:rhomboid family intramembrane serine protease [Terriglobales bacterium]